MPEKQLFFKNYKLIQGHLALIWSCRPLFRLKNLTFFAKVQLTWR